MLSVSLYGYGYMHIRVYIAPVLDACSFSKSRGNLLSSLLSLNILHYFHFAISVDDLFAIRRIEFLTLNI